MDETNQENERTGKSEKEITEIKPELAEKGIFPRRETFLTNQRRWDE